MVKYSDEQAQKGRQYLDDRRGGRGRRRSGGGFPGLGSSGRSSGGRGGIPMGKSAGGVGVLGILLIFVLQACLGGGGGGGFNIDAGGFESLEAPGAVEGQASSFDETTGSNLTVVEEEMLAVHSDLMDTWTELFDQAGLDFQTAGFVLMDSTVSTGCGPAGPEVGPFYCPAPGDNNVYLDPAFFEMLAGPRFGAGGDFARAYVQAHEVGHHIQAITGISAQVQQRQREVGTVERNELGVRTELQADCLAGVWGFHVNNRTSLVEGVLLEPGDIEEGLAAAAAVGDDRLQAGAGAAINQDTWTHGSAEQRQKWFLVGFDSGDPNSCDTFSVSRGEIGL